MLNFSWCKLNAGHCYWRSSVKGQKHRTSYSKADVALNDNAIWLIVPIVITAISIICWAEWAGDEVQHYYELKQWSFIHLIVIPLTVAVESAKPGWTHWHRFSMASFNTASATHQPLRDLSPAVSSVCVRACENSVRIVHPNWFVLPSFHSLSHTQRASNDCKKKRPSKNVWISNQH